MVDPLEWDSAFFGRRMGVLAGDPRAAGAVTAALGAARADGFEYLQCRLPIDDAVAIRALTRSGFYLTDVGATWEGSSGTNVARVGSGHSTVRPADERDLPWLEADAVQFFRSSRFYHDPFFSAAEADRLHAAWIANSVRGQAADVVWVVPQVGFVTCRLLDGHGVIGLIGVRPEARGRGAGRALMAAALDWFRSRGIDVVRVKTQVGNLLAMNFYHRLGFDLQSTDVTLGCVLQGAADDPREVAQ